MFSINRFSRMSNTAKYSTAGLVAGAAALSLAVVPGSADSGDSSQSTATKATQTPVAFTGKAKHSQPEQGGIAQQVDAVKQVQQKAAKQEAAEKAAAAKAAKDRDGNQAASRSADRSDIKKSAKPSYPNNLDGWIREARSIMKDEGIPGSYEGIHRNIIRESGGNPNAVNDWDVNAKNGVPSKGLLQTIKPTFDSYHVKGTPKEMTHPVANIVAACNYAADRYGSMDNVDSAY